VFLSKEQQQTLQKFERFPQNDIRSKERSIDQLKKALKAKFSDQELSDVESACKSLPIFDNKVEGFVDGYEEILIGDLISLKLTLKRTNFEKVKSSLYRIKN
jgi:hypothetical protein